jgi:hypothetical protein
VAIDVARRPLVGHGFVRGGSSAGAIGRLLAVGHRFLDRLYELSDCRATLSLKQQRLPTSQRSEVFRQARAAWHLSTVHEHRDHTDIRAKGSGHLDADEIFGIIEAPSARVIHCPQPPRANEDQRNIGS